MKRRLFPLCLALAACAGLLSPSAALTSGGPAQKESPLEVQVTPWGPSQDQLDAASRRLTKADAVVKLLGRTRHRLLSFDLVDPDNKTDAARVPPSRFVATFYDYSNQRAVTAEGDLDEPEAAEATASHKHPLPSDEEYDEAVSILRGDARFRVALGDGRVKTYKPMPPLVFTDKDARGRVERTLSVGLMLKDGAEMKTGRANEVVAVNLSRRRVTRYPAGAPPTAAANHHECGAANANQTTTGRGTAGQYNLIISQSGTELWNMLVVRPSASSGSDGSGVEIRDVKYRGKSVLKRGHVPILNVRYDNNVCGPFRDWQYQENMFQAAGTDVAPGIRSATSPATTVLETDNDTGNFRGVAYYTEGTKVVMVSELTAGWYRYISEWGFDANGTISPRFGYGAVANSCVCAAHHHHAYWRLDFDINTPDNNMVYEQRPSGHVSLPYDVEVKRYREKRKPVSWIVSNSTTGDAYMIKPNSQDGTARADPTGFTRGDLWVLRYRNTELDDSSVTTAATDNLDAFVDDEKIENQDLVVWYAGHFDHVQGGHASETRGRIRPKSISGSHVHGPDLIPVKW